MVKSETNEGTGRNVGEDCFLISPELLSSLSVFSGDLFGLQAEFVSRNHLDYICIIHIKDFFPINLKMSTLIFIIIVVVTAQFVRSAARYKKRKFYFKVKY